MEVFGDSRLIDRWRSRSWRQFAEKWCTNGDPWFDGQGTHGYTIVDSPSVGSLLTIEEVRGIRLEYAKRYVTRNQLRFVLSFHFDAEKYQEISFSQPSKLDQVLISGESAEHSEMRHYFLRYIQEYLFNATGYAKSIDSVKVGSLIKEKVADCSKDNAEAKCLNTFLRYFGMEQALPYWIIFCRTAMKTEDWSSVK